MKFLLAGLVVLFTSQVFANSSIDEIKDALDNELVIKTVGKKGWVSSISTYNGVYLTVSNGKSTYSGMSSTEFCITVKKDGSAYIADKRCYGH